MKILAIGAHLDDIELACGGTLAKAIKAGNQVKVMIMSQSGYTNFDGKQMRENSIAVQEGTAALKTLGITDIEILDFPTKDIPYNSEVIESIDIRMSAYNPDVIFTHHPFDTHQAHVGVSKSTISAARRKNTVFFFEPITPSGRSYVAFKPQMYVDISGTINEKIASLKEHKTEYKKFGEEWITGVTCRAGFRGYEIGTEYAEAFEVLRCELSFDNKESLL